MSLIASINRDIRAAMERDPAASSRALVFFTYPGFHARLNHRTAHGLYRKGFKCSARLLANISRFFTGIEIHPGAKIGEGLFIDHGMGVVIGATSEIGDNVPLHPGVTLGGTSTQRVKRHPTLENNVMVGVGAQIIGNITIGENSKVGAGSVVLNSVPPNATVVGVPGRVVSVRNPDTDTVEKLPDPVGERLESLEEKVAELRKRLSEIEGRKGEGI